MRSRLFLIIKFFLVVNIFQFYSFVSAQTTSAQTEDLTYLNSEFRIQNSDASFFDLIRGQANEFNSELIIVNSEFERSDLTGLYLEKIKVQGNTVFDQKELEKLIVPFLKKNLSYEQIGQITDKITALYTSNGYLTSGAFFPEQEITNAVAIIRVVEGKLERVEIRGREKLKENYLLSRLGWDSKVPLNVRRLEEKLQLLQQDPLLKKIDAKLVEGSSIGQSVLLLDVTEASPWTSTMTFNNHNSANSGEFQGIANISHQNLLGLGDRLGLEYSLTSGFDALNVGYSLPLNTRGSKLSIEYREGNNEITQSEFNDFGIRADGNTVRLQLAQSLVRQLNRDVAIFISLDKRSSNTFIEDDIPFSFVEGPDEGRSRVTALRLVSLWTERSKTLVRSAQMQFSVGLDLFDATKNENATDGLFFSWLGQLQLVKALNQKQDTLLVTRLATQLTPDSLLPLEQIVIGGANTVRGYRENRGVADNGIFGTVEVQLPLIRDSQLGDLNLVPFFDAGTIWNNDNDRDRQGALTLASLGLGVNWEIKEWFLVELDFGIPLTETSDLDDSLQDQGFHFQLQVNPLQF